MLKIQGFSREKINSETKTRVFFASLVLIDKRSKRVSATRTDSNRADPVLFGDQVVGFENVHWERNNHQQD